MQIIEGVKMTVAQIKKANARARANVIKVNESTRASVSALLPSKQQAKELNIHNSSISPIIKSQPIQRRVTIAQEAANKMVTTLMVMSNTEKVSYLTKLRTCSMEEARNVKRMYNSLKKASVINEKFQAYIDFMMSMKGILKSEGIHISYKDASVYSHVKQQTITADGVLTYAYNKQFIADLIEAMETITNQMVVCIEFVKKDDLQNKIDAMQNAMSLISTQVYNIIKWRQ